MTPLERLLGLFRFRPRRKSAGQAGRGPAVHVVILDGTMSSLEAGRETNAGLTYKLLREAGRTASLTVYYEAGIQWRDWRDTLDVIAGNGIDAQIARAYGMLASRYRPGDRIVLMGYSRGAYAARSLAGMIGRVGLLRRNHATARGVRQAFRHYQRESPDAAVAHFRDRFCHAETRIAAIGVWDTVRALGLRLPILWRFQEDIHGFHDHRLGDHVDTGYQALALDERRRAYRPVLWSVRAEDPRDIRQVWFTGTHADVGGHLDAIEAARPLANIPLVWMLNRIAGAGVDLPQGWHARFPRDPHAPSVGQWHGKAKLFWWRADREILTGPSEALHSSVEDRRNSLPEPNARKDRSR
ncbi:DUF2235 domain-containing protein [Salipiger sp. IMCC34102]|uniref:DUF2235 domain-containing protein n=1 Tax=Salipiger sp. IMCC34102 TaxID=2510647 RepID=UPI00101B6EEC|nr:DUF2235 domain-containing protein [Salipiger sp. IMCC34102]RYH02244.1 DUF2235 domain-containing protein [Salipiger sp. IMCC34102]